MKNKHYKLSAIDLFAGAGGLSCGLELAGFQILYANEVSPVFSESLTSNHPNTRIDIDDIRNISPSTIRNFLKLEPGDLDLLVGGPPCQGFSINAPLRSEKDERNHLFLNFIDFVKEFSPKNILIENVPGMVSFKKGDTIRLILVYLNDLGYNTSVRILNVANYGVPQIRWRTIFVATKLNLNPDILFPIPSHNVQARANFKTSLDGISLIGDQEKISNITSKWFVTVADAISDLPAIQNGGGQKEMAYTSHPLSDYQKILRNNSNTLWNHHCAGLGKVNIDRLIHIPQGGSWRDIPYDLLPKGMKRARKSDHTKRYGRLDLAGIGSTILTKCDPHWGAYIHPEQDRILSVREAARIQAFPDTVRFFGSIMDQYKQVGNAVPPIFAKAIGESIKTITSMYERGENLSKDHFFEEAQLELHY